MKHGYRNISKIQGINDPVQDMYHRDLSNIHRNVDRFRLPWQPFQFEKVSSDEQKRTVQIFICYNYDHKGRVAASPVAMTTR